MLQSALCNRALLLPALDSAEFNDGCTPRHIHLHLKQLQKCIADFHAAVPMKAMSQRLLTVASRHLEESLLAACWNHAQLDMHMTDHLKECLFWSMNTIHYSAVVGTAFTDWAERITHCCTAQELMHVMHSLCQGLRWCEMDSPSIGGATKGS